MAGDFQMDGYVEVKDRVAAFYAAWPDGRIVSAPAELIARPDETLAYAVTSYVYRTADDQAAGLPAGIGTAVEPYPGTTTFTRRAEAENAETSAVGRALWAAGLLAHRGASREEVQARSGPDAGPTVARAQAKGRILAAAGGHQRTAKAVWELSFSDAGAQVDEARLGVAEDVAGYIMEVRASAAALAADPVAPVEPPDPPDDTTSRPAGLDAARASLGGAGDE